MSLIKNIFKSIAILFGIVVLAVLFCFAIMMIGKVEMFGFKYLNFENTDQVFYTDVSNANKISITTNGVAVEVIDSSDVTKIEYKFVGKAQGIVKTDSIKNQDAPLNFTYGFNNGVYEIVTQEPTGLFFQNQSKLKIFIPTTMTIDDLSIKTGTNDIKFSGLNLNLSNLSFESTTELKDYTISDKVTVNKNLTLKTNSGRIYINSKINGDVLVDSVFSTIIFSKDVGKNGSAVRITGSNPHIQFGDISNDNSNVSVLGDIAVDCKNGGLIDISGSIYGTLSLISPNATLNVETTHREVTAIDGFKMLNIKNMVGDATINKGDGVLNIKSCSADNLIITGNLNDVNIEKLYGNATITNNYGDINVTYASNASQYNKFTAVTKNGKITAKNLPCEVSLTSEKGNIYAEFLNIVGNNTITTNNQVTAKVKDNVMYNLTTKSKTGGVNVNLGSTNYTNWEGAETIEGYKVITSQVNGSGSGNLIIQTNSGKINVEILI